MPPEFGHDQALMAAFLGRDGLDALGSGHSQIHAPEGEHIYQYGTTSNIISRGGYSAFVGAVCPAAPTQGSLQIMHL